MHTWLEFLSRHGAHLSQDPTPQVLYFGEETGRFPASLSASDDFVAPLTDLGLIALSGPDASHFLHNQLTNDVEHIAPHEVRLAGYCSPKGRLLASFLLWKSADVLILQLPRELQATIQKRLQMFVLRAKVKLVDITDEHILLGLAGKQAAAALSAWFPEMPTAPYTQVQSDAGTLLRVMDANGAPRYQWLAPPALAQNAWLDLTTTVQATGAATWRLGDIAAGIPQIRPATQEQFVPQMVNYECIGGVNFKKGCYPGQEIVARTQYLGKLKRRMALASIAAQDAAAGMEVFSSADPSQPCGMIVNAERCGPHEMLCLVEIKLAAQEAGGIHLGAVDDAALQFHPLPYPLVAPS